MLLAAIFPWSSFYIFPFLFENLPPQFFSMHVPSLVRAEGGTFEFHNTSLIRFVKCTEVSVHTL